MLHAAITCLERVEGIEPSHLAWQASRLPLHHTRRLVEMERIELSIPACKTGVFPLALHPHIWCGWWDSNPQRRDFKSRAYTNSATSADGLVPQGRVELPKFSF